MCAKACTKLKWTDGYFIKGILITVIIAIVAGLLSGKIVSLFGQPKVIYDDEAEFETEVSE